MLGFGVLRLAQQKGKRRGGHTWRMLVAGKGLGEDVTNGAAARQVVAASKGKEEQGRRKSVRRERFKKPREEMNLRPDCLSFEREAVTERSCKLQRY